MCLSLVLYNDYLYYGFGVCTFCLFCSNLLK